MNDAEIDEMRKQIQRETEIDPMDGGIDVPDGGDGITRYPQDGAGGVIPPDQMPDYEEPPKGEEIKLLDINPDFIFEGDEVFLGKLESGKILILQLQIKSKIKTLSVNISGKVSGDSISGVINKYIENEEE